MAESTAIVNQSKPGTVPGLIDAQRAVAEVQAQMVIAMQFPRDQRVCIDNILIACQRVGLAEDATYQYARAGTDITGPSIRLAEAMAQNWKHLQYGFRVIDDNEQEATVQTYCWDLQNNVKAERTFTVPSVRYTKKDGSKALVDPRDIYENIANNASRRMRACILEIIPSDVTDVAVAECEKTLKASADTSPEAIKKMLAIFAKEFNVTKDQIEKRIQRKVDAITPAQFIGLRRIFNSLKDGMSTPSDWFEDARANATVIEKPKAPDSPKEDLDPFNQAMAASGTKGKSAKKEPPKPEPAQSETVDPKPETKSEPAEDNKAKAEREAEDLFK